MNYLWGQTTDAEHPHLLPSAFGDQVEAESGGLGAWCWVVIAVAATAAIVVWRMA